MRWRDVPGFCGVYQVSDAGDVRRVVANGSTGRVGLVKGSILRRMKYRHVTLSRPGKKRKVLVHVLVLEVFVGPRPAGMQARHRNGDGSDNRLKNLQWGTPSQNQMDRLVHGTSNRGEHNPMAKLTIQRVREIKARLAAGDRVRELGRELGISHTLVSNIKTGSRWGWVA